MGLKTEPPYQTVNLQLDNSLYKAANTFLDPTDEVLLRLYTEQ